MDFVNRLRADHLTSFWYFPSKVNFALVATFGSLLLATAPCQEEAEFYRARLGEYRWTLSVSAKNAGFLTFAIESLESSTDLLKCLPMKPKIEDLDVRQVPPPPPITRLVPPQEEDETMEDVPMPNEDFRHAPPILEDIGEVMESEFDPMSPGTMNTESMVAFNGCVGPFAGTPFAGLGARDWFDNSHHGSPEAERMGMLSG